MATSGGSSSGNHHRLICTARATSGEMAKTEKFETTR